MPFLNNSFINYTAKQSGSGSDSFRPIDGMNSVCHEAPIENKFIQ